MSTHHQVWAHVHQTEDERATGDRGNSFVEYALVVALIVLVCLAAMNTLGKNTSTHFSETADKVALAN